MVFFFLDFRTQNFKKWREHLKTMNSDSLLMTYTDEAPGDFTNATSETKKAPRKEIRTESCGKKKLVRPKKTKEKVKNEEIFRADPKSVFFMDFKPGEVYEVSCNLQEKVILIIIYIILHYNIY